MNPRHAIPRRPRKDRDVTWSRSFRNGLVTWTLWRRDYRRTVHMRTVVVTRLWLEHQLAEVEPMETPKRLRRAWHELRDFVDEIDLKEIA